MILDIAIVVIILIFVIIGIKKGFAFSLISLFGGTVNLFFATILTGPFKSLLSTIGLTGSIQGVYASKMATMAGFETELVGMGAEELTTTVNNAINNSGFSWVTKTLTRWFCKLTPENIAHKTSCTLKDILSDAYSSFWSTFIAFAVAFGLIYLVLFLISKAMKAAKRDRAFDFFDKVLGLLFGLVRGAMSIAFLIAILSLFSENGLLGPVIDYVKASKIGGWGYNLINPIVDHYINFENIIAAIRGSSGA